MADMRPRRMLGAATLVGLTLAWAAAALIHVHRPPLNNAGRPRQALEASEEALAWLRRQMAIIRGDAHTTLGLAWGKIPPSKTVSGIPASADSWGSTRLPPATTAMTWSKTTPSPVSGTTPKASHAPAISYRPTSTTVTSPTTTTPSSSRAEVVSVTTPPAPDTGIILPIVHELRPSRDTIKNAVDGATAMIGDLATRDTSHVVNDTLPAVPHPEVSAGHVWDVRVDSPTISNDLSDDPSVSPRPQLQTGGAGVASPPVLRWPPTHAPPDKQLPTPYWQNYFMNQVIHELKTRSPSHVDWFSPIWRSTLTPPPPSYARSSVPTELTVSPQPSISFGPGPHGSGWEPTQGPEITTTDASKMPLHDQNYLLLGGAPLPSWARVPAQPSPYFLSPTINPSVTLYPVSTPATNPSFLITNSTETFTTTSVSLSTTPTTTTTTTTPATSTTTTALPSTPQRVTTSSTTPTTTTTNSLTTTPATTTTPASSPSTTPNTITLPSTAPAPPLQRVPMAPLQYQYITAIPTGGGGTMLDGGGRHVLPPELFSYQHPQPPLTRQEYLYTLQGALAQAVFLQHQQERHAAAAAAAAAVTAATNSPPFPGGLGEDAEPLRTRQVFPISSQDGSQPSYLDPDYYANQGGQLAYLVYPDYEAASQASVPASSSSTSNMELLYPWLALGQSQLQNQSQSVVNEVHSYQNLVIQLANGTNVTSVSVTTGGGAGDGTVAVNGVSSDGGSEGADGTSDGSGGAGDGEVSAVDGGGGSGGGDGLSSSGGGVGVSGDVSGDSGTSNSSAGIVSDGDGTNGGSDSITSSSNTGSDSTGVGSGGSDGGSDSTTGDGGSNSGGSGGTSDGGQGTSGGSGGTSDGSGGTSGGSGGTSGDSGGTSGDTESNGGTTNDSGSSSGGSGSTSGDNGGSGGTSGGTGGTIGDSGGTSGGNGGTSGSSDSGGTSGGTGSNEGTSAGSGDTSGGSGGTSDGSGGTSDGSGGSSDGSGGSSDGSGGSSDGSGGTSDGSGGSSDGSGGSSDGTGGSSDGSGGSSDGSGGSSDGSGDISGGSGGGSGSSGSTSDGTGGTSSGGTSGDSGGSGGINNGNGGTSDGSGSGSASGGSGGISGGSTGTSSGGISGDNGGNGGTSDGNGGTSDGSGGTSDGSGGTSVGSGGTSDGSGGTSVGSGGTSDGSGGTSDGSGGTSDGSGGTSGGNGGASDGSGGTPSGGNGNTSGDSGGASTGSTGSGGAGGVTIGDGGNVLRPEVYRCNERGDATMTNFVNPSYPYRDTAAGICMFRLDLQPSVCQVRVDVVETNLAAPTEGVCVRQYLTVQGTVWRPGLGRLCGTNSDTHFYLEVEEGVPAPYVEVAVASQAGLSYRWGLWITQIDCLNPSPLRAPTGCFQYFPESSGVLKSFSFDDGQYYVDQHYRLCLGVAPGTCSVTFTSQPRHFMIEKYGNTDEVPFDRSGMSSLYCVRDYLRIPEGSADGSLYTASHDRYCGGHLAHTHGAAAPSPVTSRVTSRVVALEFHAGIPHKFMAKAHGPGFKILYQHNPCVPQDTRLQQALPDTRSQRPPVTLPPPPILKVTLSPHLSPHRDQVMTNRQGLLQAPFYQRLASSHPLLYDSSHTRPGQASLHGDLTGHPTRREEFDWPSYLTRPMYYRREDHPNGPVPRPQHPQPTKQKTQVFHPPQLPHRPRPPQLHSPSRRLEAQHTDSSHKETSQTMENNVTVDGQQTGTVSPDLESRLPPFQLLSHPQDLINHTPQEFLAGG